MNDEAVYRTAPATPGLLITVAPSLRPSGPLLKILNMFLDIQGFPHQNIS